MSRVVPSPGGLHRSRWPSSASARHLSPTKPEPWLVLEPNSSADDVRRYNRGVTEGSARRAEPAAGSGEAVCDAHLIGVTSSPACITSRTSPHAANLPGNRCRRSAANMS